MKTAHDYGYSKEDKLATTACEAMNLFDQGWRQISDYCTNGTVAALPIEEWRPETRARDAEINARVWVVFAPPA